MSDYMTSNRSTAMPSSVLFKVNKHIRVWCKLLYQYCPTVFTLLQHLDPFPIQARLLFFFFYVFFCAACACFKGHLLVCHSGICRGSSLNGHLSEKVTAPPDSSSRSHFQHACGRWLIIHSLRFRLSPAQGAAHIHIPPCKMYTIVCLPCLCLCQLYVLS